MEESLVKIPEQSLPFCHLKWEWWRLIQKKYDIKKKPLIFLRHNSEEQKIYVSMVKSISLTFTAKDGIEGLEVVLCATNTPTEVLAIILKIRIRLQEKASLALELDSLINNCQSFPVPCNIEDIEVIRKHMREPKMAEKIAAADIALCISNKEHIIYVVGLSPAVEEWRDTIWNVSSSAPALKKELNS